MTVRREDPNYPDYAPSPLVEAILGLLEEADVDEKTCDAVSLVVEAAQSQVAGEHAADRLLRDPRLAAALQGLRSSASVAVSASMLDVLRDLKNTCENAPSPELMVCIHKVYERACAAIQQAEKEAANGR